MFRAISQRSDHDSSNPRIELTLRLSCHRALNHCKRRDLPQRINLTFLVSSKFHGYNNKLANEAVLANIILTKTYSIKK